MTTTIKTIHEGNGAQALKNFQSAMKQEALKLAEGTPLELRITTNSNRISKWSSKVAVATMNNKLNSRGDIKKWANHNQYVIYDNGDIIIRWVKEGVFLDLMIKMVLGVLGFFAVKSWLFGYQKSSSKKTSGSGGGLGPQISKAETTAIVIALVSGAVAFFHWREQS